MVVDMKVFILSTYLTKLNTGELVVNHTVDGEDNQEEKTMEVADIRMYHFGWNFLQLGCDMSHSQMLGKFEYTLPAKF